MPKETIILPEMDRQGSAELAPISTFDTTTDIESTLQTGDATKTDIAKVLEQEEVVLSPELQQFLDRLIGQCENVASFWTEIYPIENALPKDELITRAERFLRSLPVEKLQAFYDICPNSAELVIIPEGITVPQLLQLIKDNNPNTEQIIREDYIPSNWKKVKSERWKVAIADCQDGFPLPDNIIWLNPDAPEGKRRSRSILEIVAEYKRIFNQKGLAIMPQYGVVPIGAKQLTNGIVKNVYYWTVFEKPIDSPLLPLASWEDFISLDFDEGKEFFHYVRCRPWIEGDLI